MEAVVFHDYNDARVEEVPRPTPSEDEVLIATSRVQLSVTECNLYRGEKIAHYDQIKRRLSTGPTRMLGHEFCGTVVETGVAVNSLSPGDRVYAPGKIPCLDCQYCRAGYTHNCPDKTSVGYQTEGGLAEYFTLHERPLCKLPDGISEAEGAAMQPFHSSVICANDAPIASGDVVAVIGNGVMGNQCAQLAKFHGADQVFAVDVEPDKLAIADDQGLRPINAMDADPVEVVHEATDGVGADVVFEAVGGAQNDGTNGDDPLAQAMRMVRQDGSVVEVGHIIDEVSFTARTLRSKSVDWLHPRTGRIHFGPNADSGELAANLVAKDRISIDDYVTHVLDGLDSFEELVEITLNKPQHDALGPAQIRI